MTTSTFEHEPEASVQGTAAPDNRGRPSDPETTPGRVIPLRGPRVGGIGDSMALRSEDLRRRRADASRPPGTDQQHARGKLTARERIAALVDPGSFTELEPFRRHRAHGFGLDRRRPDTDGVITGWGRVDGRRVFLYAHDFRIFGGSLGEAHAAKIHKVMDLALAAGVPLIGLNDGAGARIQEGISALAGFGGIFRRNVRASGVIPQISVMLGPCAGGAAYSPALTDFVFMVDTTSNMFLTGPDVVRSVTGEAVSRDDLGGAQVHARTTGIAAFVSTDEIACLRSVRELLAFLPDNHTAAPNRVPSSDRSDRSCSRLADIVPVDPRKTYDMAAVIADIVDDGEFTEVHALWARNIICAFARLDGEVVGIVANQPRHRAGVLDIRAAEKAARFVRTCDAFNIPLVSLVDVPGFLPGVDQERGGVIRHGAKLLFAYCEATVPRIQVIVRKAYGGAYIVMDSPSIGAHLSFAWPTAEIGVMGAAAAVAVLHRDQLRRSDRPAQLRDQLAAEYRADLLHPFHAAEQGMVHDVIDPRNTRRVLIDGFAALGPRTERPTERKHGNHPL